MKREPFLSPTFSMPIVSYWSLATNSKLPGPMQPAPQFEHFVRSERDGTLSRRKADKEYPSAVQLEDKPEGDAAAALDHPRGRCFRTLRVSWARVIFDIERSNPFWTSE